jgi:hypothetical protein
VLKGFENVQRFSPEAVGRVYLEIYQEVASANVSPAPRALVQTIQLERTTPQLNNRFAEREDS